MIKATAEKLRAVGHTVTSTIEAGHRTQSTAEIEADHAQRQQDRAEAITAKADGRPPPRGAHDHALELADQIPFGQPILVCV